MKRWFWDDDNASGVEEVEISRDQRVAAGIAGWGNDELRVYRVLGDPMNAVEPCIFFSEPVVKLGVTFAPAAGQTLRKVVTLRLAG